MKRLKYILTLLTALLTVGCSTVDFGDLNVNKNGATEPYTAGLLSGAIMSYATYTGRDGLLKPTLYVQYQSQVTYVDEMLYSESPSSWYTYYVSSMENLQQIIDFVSNKDNQTSALLSQGSAENQIGVAMIMKAIIMKRVTDTWGDVPYTDAFKGSDALNPTYDKQENIYKALIANLKKGRDMLNASTTGPTGDIIYDGDVSKWKKLANSYILQMSLTLYKRYPTPSGYAATEFKAALNNAAGVIETVDDEAWFQYEDISGFRNPWNANRTPDYFLSREFTDAMNGNNTTYNPTSNRIFDERLMVYADDYTLPGVPYGHRDGSGAGASSVSNDYYWNNTSPLPMMTASYTFLNRAEAADLGWTSENVTSMLQKGITMSFATLQSHTGVTLNAAPYVAARLADAGVVGNYQVIAEEKWFSLFGMGFDAWVEWRRTGYPDLTPAADHYNNGQIPRRYLYPVEEPGLNGPNYKTGISGLSPAEDKGTSRVWWDKQ